MKECEEIAGNYILNLAIEGRDSERGKAEHANAPKEASRDMTDMPTRPTSTGADARRPATRADFHRTLGDLDDPKIIEILELNPSVADLEQAAMCVAGDQDVLAKSGHRITDVAARVAEILAADEEEDGPTPPPPRE